MSRTIGTPTKNFVFASTSKGKNTACITPYAKEAFKERIGIDPDIDPARADLNIYSVCHTADEFLNLLKCAVDRINEERVRSKKRPLNNGNVIAIGIIFKPDVMIMKSLTRDEQIKFLSDCIEWTKNTLGEINFLGSAMHFDEANPHVHTFFLACDKEGNWIGSNIRSLPFLGSLNRDFPVFMRSKGWDVDDPFDYLILKEHLGDERFEEYKRNPRSKCGRPSFRFKAEAEEEKRHIEECIGFLDGLRSELKETIKNLEEDVKTLSNSRDELIGTVKSRSDELARIVLEKDRAVEMLGIVAKKINNGKTELNKMTCSKQEAEESIADLRLRQSYISKEIEERSRELEHIKKKSAEISSRMDHALAVIHEADELAERELDYKRRIDQLENEKYETESRYSEALEKISEAYGIPYFDLLDTAENDLSDSKYRSNDPGEDGPTI
ncbi:MAG: plasmid recombination protein [Ruminococcus sp.]|nr:plasmid recombination protein [Ruminococcus sp.]